MVLFEVDLVALVMLCNVCALNFDVCFLCFFAVVAYCIFFFFHFYVVK